MGRQPLLHDGQVMLRAPMQAWCRDCGEMRAPADGLYMGDTRIISGYSLAIAGERTEHLAVSQATCDVLLITALARAADGTQADPRVRVDLHRRVTGVGFSETIRVINGRERAIVVPLELRFTADATPMASIKEGGEGVRAVTLRVPGGVEWSSGTVVVRLETAGLDISTSVADIVLAATVSVPPGGEAEVRWSASASDPRAVVAAVDGPVPWRTAGPAGDERLNRWLARAMGDLDGLRMSLPALPGRQFLAAGAPWFFTLFGRDSLWSARLLLPLGTALAADTLEVLAAMQGATDDVESCEQPGKILHEIRAGHLVLESSGISLPPVYYGSVDSTLLWICLLHDVWAAGDRPAVVERLLPHLERALAWMRDFGDADGDGLIEYVDSSGTGLANQGWKDSGDSVQWMDGSLARAPIALCEVQGYAYEAALGGAAVLEAHGRDGAEWRAWAARLQTRFHEYFWVDPDGAGPYPAIALDADKRPVDSPTSNIGHLLGTGLLDAEQSRAVVRRLTKGALISPYGLRTMSPCARGYWPLSYHGGSIWAHDTAIVIRGLVKAGHRDVAQVLALALLDAAEGFGYRIPELYGGDAATLVPYPAACRPQAWSAAAAVVVSDALRAMAPGSGS